jgi:predicted thioesterase
VTITRGATGAVTHVVGDADTALALGSGDVPVLGTPRLLAWCEAATVAATRPSLAPGETSVGTRVTLEHLRATPIGARLTATATVVHVDGRLVRCEVVAEHEVGDEPAVVVGHGEVTRVVVDRDRFAHRASS